MGDSFLCFGHRGACGHEPENTLRSLRCAMELGVDGIEVDVHLVEGRLVVVHDATVDRTTDGCGSLAALGLAALRRLDAGGGERIPLLEEVLDLVDGKVILNVELKGRGTAGPVAALLEDRIRGGWPRERTLVSSFHRSELEQIARGPVPLGVLHGRVPAGFEREAAALGAASVHTDVRFTGACVIECAHGAGLRVFAYTVNSPREIERMRALGADGVFSDFPERVIRS